MAPCVLYVDDDEANLAVFEAACQGVFPLRVASSGAAALEVMRTEEVGVLLTDQRMPGMTGVELAERVRDEHPECIRLLVTAYADLAATIDAINRGKVHRYLKKPWDAAELKLSLRDDLERFQLGRQLRQLERRLTEMERIYTLGIVAASIGHEIRNPLGNVVVYHDLAASRLEKLRGSLPPDQHAELTSAHEDLTQANACVMAALEIIRGIELSARKQQHEQEVVDLADVARLTLLNVQGELRYRARQRHEIEVVPKILGSRTRLGQVILNLLVNAVHAMPERHINENWIALRVRQDGEQVVVEVEDNGSGIPKDALEKVFDPFFTTKGAGGTGLGLAISRQIAEELGGTLEVRSEVGVGTCFTLRIPTMTNT